MCLWCDVAMERTFGTFKSNERESSCTAIAKDHCLFNQTNAVRKAPSEYKYVLPLWLCFKIALGVALAMCISDASEINPL